jgi:superfamily I DNA/RNA helicase
MIERINEQVAYNPVREHINIEFLMVADKSQQVAAILDDLLNQGFDPSLSRVLIFVRSRKLAEELTEEIIDSLEKISMPWAENVGFFHAGMDSTDRETNYDDFQNGKKLILVATKAFGMGMDIPNIHYVYHFGPSSTFEDFLQEVGRAGRNKEKLNIAGFSIENPIKTKCILTKEDFGKLKDLNHKSAISWNNIKAVQKVIFNYVSKFKPLKPNSQEAFPLPFDLLNSDSQFDEEHDKDSLFRLSLYWLERLGRIRLGLFTPAFLPIKLNEEGINFQLIKNDEQRLEVATFCELLQAYKAAKFPEKDTIAIPMVDLRQLANNKNHFELFRFLFAAQKAKAISIDRYITLEPTELRTAEIDSLSLYNKGLTIEAVFELAEKILNSTKLRGQVSFDGSYLDSLVHEVADEYFLPNKVFWTEFTKKSNKERSAEEICRKLKEDFIKKRLKFAFSIITMLPKMRHQSIIQTTENKKKGEVVNLIYNGNTTIEQWLRPLQNIKKDLDQFILKVAADFKSTGKKTLNYSDLLIKLGCEDKDLDYFPNLIFLSKALGYFKGGGTLIPMGIELFIDDISEINEKDRTGKDYPVFQDFKEGLQLKELRLLALECLSQLKKRTDQDLFIKNYFTCSSSSELLMLLEEKFGEGHPNLKAFRKEALAREEAKLSEQQRKVYDTPIDVNLQVLAGPGSGKTHTLTLRVARLIQNEQVNPEQILILAYNRAVVVELKDRLAKLFKELGYSKLISRLKVFTFHGFCKFCLENELDEVAFDSWVPEFLKKLNHSPGRINQKLGLIKYVFVDEFQDITNNRLELLKRIADPERARICVIGDPNQSIYGYDRINEGGKISPKPYYDAFARIYNPTEYNLTINYRSYPEIIAAAEDLLSKNKPEFILPKLEAFNKSEAFSNSCEIINWKETKVDWRDVLKKLLTEEYGPGKRYQQIAIMYRSNEEVFRAFNEIQGLGLQGVRARVQGSSSSPYRSREFFHFIKLFKEKRLDSIPSSYIKNFEKEKDQILSKYSNWDNYLINLLHCILIEFQVEMGDDSTYQDLIDFIEDLTGRDEGHYAKIFEKHINEVNEGFAVRELVLTTMHKVKGVEYDAVIIPPSFTDLPLKEELDSARLEELIEEERRLLYVAYTRAKYRLVVLKFERELALDIGVSHIFSDKIKSSLGIVVKSGLDKFFISYGATDSGNLHFDLIKNLKVGQSLDLVKPTTNWFLKVGSSKIGCLNGKISNIITNKSEGKSRVTGFSISSIEVWTYEETLAFDIKNETNFAKSWAEKAKERGYIYLTEFSGFGKPQD